MNTPICDFINRYSERNPVRLHMPGHKGKEGHGSDITEIDGADILSAPSGIIAESEANAGRLFGCDTFYSTEGSSLCIRAMLFLIKKRAVLHGRKTLILAGRNVHSSFINAAAVLDVDVEWIMQRECDSYESCFVSGQDIEEYVESHKNRMPDAVYITSPDYLGNIQDIGDIARTCHRYGMVLLVDCAHGAYLRFLENSLYPTDLGADICCSSAHKTLPVLTGGAYLNISKMTEPFFTENVRQALSIFASTSPSYLILQSLDAANRYIEDNKTGKDSFRKAVARVEDFKSRLREKGYIITGDEPLKVTLYFGEGSSEDSYPDGMPDGDSVAGLMEKNNIFVEYHDKTHLVMMLSTKTSEEEYRRTEESLSDIALRFNIRRTSDTISCENMLHTKRLSPPVRAMSFMEAMMAPSEYVPAEKSIGRISAGSVLSCPPCVPVYMCGEVIGDDILRFYSGPVKVVI